MVHERHLLYNDGVCYSNQNLSIRRYSKLFKVLLILLVRCLIDMIVYKELGPILYRRLFSEVVFDGVILPQGLVSLVTFTFFKVPE